MRLLNRILALSLSSLLIYSISFPLSSWAEGEDDPLWSRPTYEKKVSQVGQRILAANNIDMRISFMVLNAKEGNPNAYARSKGSSVAYINKSLLKYIESDDELAAILSHEIAHIILKHSRLSNTKHVGRALLKSTLVVGALFTYGATLLALPAMKGGRASHSRNKETQADLVGVDLLHKAGYNPLAMETLNAKIGSDASSKFSAFWRSHPAGTKRLGKIHEHIAEFYPQFIDENSDKHLPGSPYEFNNDDANKIVSVEKVINTEKSAKENNINESNIDLQESLALLSFSEGTEAIETAKVDSPFAQAPKQVNQHAFSDKTLPAPTKVASKNRSLKSKSSKKYSSPSKSEAGSLSIAQAILSLDSDQIRLLKFLSKEEFFNSQRLRDEFGEIPVESLQAMVSSMENKQLIRILGQAPDQIFILSDEVAKQLKPQ